MIQLRLISLVTFLFFLFTVSSNSTEYICSCEKHNAVKITIKNGKSKTERESTCSETKEKILLEYEEGYIAIGSVNGSGLYPYDNITEDNKNFVKPCIGEKVVIQRSTSIKSLKL